VALQSAIYRADYEAASMTAEDVPSTPAAAGWGTDLASHRPLTPQQGTTPGITPISKAIALLQHRSSTTPNASQGRTQRTAELSARKAELATLLNQVTNCCNPSACTCIARSSTTLMQCTQHAANQACIDDGRWHLCVHGWACYGQLLMAIACPA